MLYCGSVRAMAGDVQKKCHQEIAGSNAGGSRALVEDVACANATMAPSVKPRPGVIRHIPV
jgi:hypothetical protein